MKRNPTNVRYAGRYFLAKEEHKFRETAMMNNHRNVKYVADSFLHAEPKE